MRARYPLLIAVIVVGLWSGCSGTDVIPADVETAGNRPPESPGTAPVETGPIRTDLGTIQGHVALVGRAPGNRVIRMGMDPRCAEINEATLVVQTEVAVTAEGDLANVFIQLDGEFQTLPPPATPVRIDQMGCVYMPRVVGVQVGQTVEIRNSDDLPHNLHASSAFGSGFNVGQPQTGMVYRFVPETPETMMRLSCDLHRWMTTYIGIVSHPYFDVTQTDGTFTIEEVPAGTYTIRAWHEVYGELTARVEVREDELAMADFEYSVDD